LGARDTLRIEAALPLYGHEMDATVDPISLGMGWAVNKEAEFLGSDRLRPIAQEGPSRVLVGLELDGRRTARQGNAVVADQVPVGAVTSGCFSPTLGKSVAMAFVGSEYAGIGGEIGVDFRREVVRATVTPLPFYKRA
jgi:aminomethyltransferase